MAPYISVTKVNNDNTMANKDRVNYDIDSIHHKK